eukprot:s5160_g7.t1
MPLGSQHLGAIYSCRGGIDELLRMASPGMTFVAGTKEHDGPATAAVPSVAAPAPAERRERTRRMDVDMKLHVRSVQ